MQERKKVQFNLQGVIQMNHKTLMALTIVTILLISLSLTSKKEMPTGRILGIGMGCCELTCTDMSGLNCPSNFFHEGESCFDLGLCNVGCCIDGEGYCYTNYAKNYCEREGKKFISSRECTEYKECWVPPEFPADQEGYMMKRGRAVLYVNPSPSSGRIGEEFVIQATLINPASKVELNIFSENFNRTYLMYDDGFGDDDFMNDEIYTLAWNSLDHPQINEITAVRIKPIVDGKVEEENYEIYLSPNTCVPSITPWNQSSKPKIVFARKGNSNKETGNVAVYVMSQFSKNYLKMKEYDIYNIQAPVDENDALTKCPFALGEGVVVLLDKEELFCRQNGNLVVVNEDFITNGRTVPFNFMADFCKYVTTVKKTEYDFMSSLEEPRVVIHIPDNDTFTDNELLISFSAYDNESSRLRYKIYSDSTYGKLGWGYMNANDTITRTINIEDGSHELYVVVEDLDANEGFNERTVLANASNFVAFASLEEEVFSSPDFVFNISFNHKTEETASYIVKRNNIPIKKGNATRNELSEVNVTLPYGEHEIIAVFTDSSGRTATTELSYAIINPLPSPVPTGNMIFNLERMSPVTNVPYPGAPVEGWQTDENYLNPNYGPVDDAGLYEPKKLCSAEGDTGARFKPLMCMNTTEFIVTGNALSKDLFGTDYYYEYEYSVYSCIDNLFIDIFLEDESGNQEEIYSSIADMGYEVVDKDTFRSFGNYTKFCIYTSLSEKQCFVFGPKECNDNLDNDNDGLTDMDDPGCAVPYDNYESDGTSECQDGIDNENDGLIDAADPACIVNGVYVKTKNNEAALTSQCQDGIDNDNDGLCDFNGCQINGNPVPNDPGCLSRTDDRESDGTSQCQDGRDNDNNGFFDYPSDLGCTSLIDFTESPSQCDDGIDNDGNGWTDLEDMGCDDLRDDLEHLEGNPCDSHDGTHFSSRVLKTPEYEYAIDYELYSCKERMSYEIYLHDFTEESFETVSRGILEEDESKAESVVITSQVDHKQMCIKTSDTSFGTEGAECIDI